MAGTERIRRVANIVRRQAEGGNEVAVVVSAMAGETDRLVNFCREANPLFDPAEYDVVGASGEQVTSGLLAPTSGIAMVAGLDAVADPEGVRRRIGYMSQRFGLYDDLTVRENLRFYSELYGVVGAEGRERRAAVLEEFGLRERASQLVGTLSGGWKQRLALACATAHRPRLVFLDEPTAGVDPAARRHFWEIIHGLAHGGLTVLVTTHYMDEAERCDRLALLSRGDLIAVGTPGSIKQQFGQPSIEDVFIELQRQDEGALA